jgi:phosphomannomutase
MADMRKKGYSSLLAHEEAIGYSLFDIIADKDGISTLLAATLMALYYHQQGKTLHAARDALFERLGIVVRHISCSLPLAINTQQDVMAHWRAQMPARLLVYQWQHRQDFFVTPLETWPANIIRDTWQHIQNPKQQLRTMLRPSGTETKLKYYLELFYPLTPKYHRAHEEVARLDAELAEIAKVFATHLF